MHENISLPSYTLHTKGVVYRDGVLLSKSDFLNLKDDEQYEGKTSALPYHWRYDFNRVSESDATSLENY